MKKCSLCKKELDISNFAKKLNGVQSRCRECHSLYTRKHYSENKQYYVDKAKQQNLLQKEKSIKLILESFASGCSDCGNMDVRVLEFDHLGNKTANISNMLTHSTKRLKEEISKCEVVCCNCHRIRTSSRANDWRSQHVSVYPHATNV